MSTDHTICQQDQSELSLGESSSNFDLDFHSYADREITNLFKGLSTEDLITLSANILRVAQYYEGEKIVMDEFKSKLEAGWKL